MKDCWENWMLEEVLQSTNYLALARLKRFADSYGRCKVPCAGPYIA